jgi:hypothetical protein
MWKNTVAIHNVLKKNNYKAKLLISSILKKKLKSMKTILWKENLKNEKNRKKNWGKKQN